MTPTTLLIRYASPDSTPARYGPSSHFGVSPVISDDYWTLTGPRCKDCRESLVDTYVYPCARHSHNRKGQRSA